jgi:hypothetical protein
MISHTEAKRPADSPDSLRRWTAVFVSGYAVLEASAKFHSVSYTLFGGLSMRSKTLSGVDLAHTRSQLPSPGGRALAMKAGNRLPFFVRGPHLRGITSPDASRLSVHRSNLGLGSARYNDSACFFVPAGDFLGNDFAHDLGLRSGISARSLSMLEIKRVCKSRCSGLP